MHLSLSDLLKYADTNVSIGTMIVGVALIYFSYALVKKTASFFSSLLGRFPATFMASGLLLVFGLAGMGYGIGELSTADPTPIPLTNNELIKLVTAKDVNQENVQILVDYAKARDSNQTPSIEQASIEKPAFRLAWTSILGGTGMFLVGFMMFVVKVNS